MCAVWRDVEAGKATSTRFPLARGRVLVPTCAEIIASAHNTVAWR